MYSYDDAQDGDFVIVDYGFLYKNAFRVRE